MSTEKSQWLKTRKLAAVVSDDVRHHLQQLPSLTTYEAEYHTFRLLLHVRSAKQHVKLFRNLPKIDL
jgi:hypothetical protein